MEQTKNKKREMALKNLAKAKATRAKLIEERKKQAATLGITTKQLKRTQNKKNKQTINSDRITTLVPRAIQTLEDAMSGKGPTGVHGQQAIMAAKTILDMAGILKGGAKEAGRFLSEEEADKIKARVLQAHNAR